MASDETVLPVVKVGVSADRREAAACGADLTRTAWLANLRQDLLTPLAALFDLTDALLKDVRERGQADLLADLQKVRTSEEQLRSLIEQLLDPARANGANDGLSKKARHDLRNPLNHVIGYAELWLESASELLLEAFVPDLKRMEGLAKQVLARLDELVSCSEAASAPDIDLRRVAVPEMIRGLVESLPRRPRTGSAAAPAAAARVLVADDHENNRDLLTRLLQREGHAVTAASDGNEALKLLRAQPFDLVLLDMIMPGLNGLQVLEQVKADVNLRRLPIIMVSAFDELDCVARCIEMGAEDYLPKPIKPLLLKARIDACLERKRVQQRDLEQFFPAEVVQQLLSQPDLLHQGQKVDVTVLFCDIRGFSRVSERLSAGETMRWLSGVMEVLSDCVFRHQGVLVDFIGDELMAFWGAPQPQPDHASRACRAALDMLAELPRSNWEWKSVIRTQMSLSIGVNSGPAHVGNTGTRRRFKYGPHGHIVNLASRVQGATKFLQSKLLITGATRQYLDDSFAVRRVATARAVNIDAPVDLYELVPPGLAGWPTVKQDYEHALECFEAQMFKEAAEILSRLLTAYGAQGPELSLMSRTMECLVDPSRWKKAWDLPGK